MSNLIPLIPLKRFNGIWSKTKHETYDQTKAFAVCLTLLIRLHHAILMCVWRRVCVWGCVGGWKLVCTECGVCVMVCGRVCVGASSFRLNKSIFSFRWAETRRKVEPCQRTPNNRWRWDFNPKLYEKCPKLFCLALLLKMSKKTTVLIFTEQVYTNMKTVTH